MDTGVVGSALYALSPDYVRLGRRLAAEDSSIDLQVIDGVTAEARRSVGQWPTGESLIEQLVTGLDTAAEQETDPDRRNRLRDVARGLGGAAKSIAIDIAATGDRAPDPRSSLTAALRRPTNQLFPLPLPHKGTPFLR
jgi:hypothetical protein